MYYVYLLVNEKGTTYVGYTNNLGRRYQEHQTGKNIYTRKGVWRLVYYEA
jgi:predicted GIY-YIG superfamily endonuclease